MRHETDSVTKQCMMHFTCVYIHMTIVSDTSTRYQISMYVRTWQDRDCNPGTTFTVFKIKQLREHVCFFVCCVCVCIYIYIYIYIYMYIQAQAYKHKYAQTIHKFTPMHTCDALWLPPHTCVYKYNYTKPYRHFGEPLAISKVENILGCMYVCIYVYMYECLHVCTVVHTCHRRKQVIGLYKRVYAWPMVHVQGLPACVYIWMYTYTYTWHVCILV